MKSLIVAIALFTIASGHISAAQVDSKISSREAYVGVPITLQISITDATSYERPQIPEIDGCDVRSAGSPSQSSRITIINGRRSASRSVTMQYLITPRREGSFEIPAISVEADGKTTTIPPQRFVVTKSVTGDLLFVEVEGGKERVFVGQPLDLVLKIWIKPYRDRERNLTLSEQDMWSMISKQSAWGSFASRMKDLGKNGQRPAGREVLRDDGMGNERGYYLYEIETTVYPKRPGKIDADDVQIVVDYPTALGQSRSPLGSIFEDGPFGPGSPFSDLMEDDFFGSNFGNRLAVTSARPIVGEVSVGSTTVVPVPNEGRPIDYRGAVGRYQIVTQATPTTVDAGDPITLNIGISGTGPMELVQAPPLSELTSLVADFKVADDSLAGFVQDDAKVFSTTIRPRREGITEIPAIRFSFFDPDTEQYQTVTSDPIAISVNKSEMLSLDAIVGNSRGSSGSFESKSTSGTQRNPNLTNDNSPKVLESHSPSAGTRLRWLFAVVPAVTWLIVWLVQSRASFFAWFPSIRSARSRCLSTLAHATDRDSITEALRQYVSRRSGKSCTTIAQALGILRVAGMTTIANGLEAHFSGGSSMDLTSAGGYSPAADESVEGTQLHFLRAHAALLVDKMESAFSERAKVRVSTPHKRFNKPAMQRAVKRSLILLIASALTFPATISIAAQSIELSTSQRNVVLEEAASAYAHATELAQTDSADAKELFQTAARKYQLLVDSGIHNGQLYANLGNAYLQSGELGRAIVNYEKASQYQPSVPNVAVNLEFAEAQVTGQAKPTSTTTPLLNSSWQVIKVANATLNRFLGSQALLALLAISSALFWGLWILRTLGFRFPIWRYALLPALIMLFSMGSLALAATSRHPQWDAVIVANKVTLYAGDGEQFDEILSIDSAQGHRVAVILERGSWTKVRTVDGHSGWIPAQAIESIAEHSR